MTIGFIGLGSLGTPIAENILESTQQLYVYNRTASRAQPLLAKGAATQQAFFKKFIVNNYPENLATQPAPKPVVTQALR